MILRKNKDYICEDDNSSEWRIVEITSGMVMLEPINGPKMIFVVSKSKWKEKYWLKAGTKLIL